MKKVAYLAGLLGLALFVVLLVRSNGHDIVQVNTQAGWRLLWLVPYRGVYFLLFAVGWCLLLRSDTGTPWASLGYLFWVTGVREAIDRLLPVASVGGAFAGVRLLGWRGFDRVRVTASVITEIVLTLWASYLFAALGFLLWLQVAGAPGARMLWLVLLGTLPVPLACWLLLRHGRLFARLQRGLGTVVGIERLSGSARALDEALRSLLGRSGVLSLAGLLQLASLLSASLEIWLALRWFGHPIGMAQAVILEAATQAVRHLAFFVPAALGVQEAGLIAFGQLLGVSPEVALALSLAKRMREILWRVAIPDQLAMAGGVTYPSAAAAPGAPMIAGGACGPRFAMFLALATLLSGVLCRAQSTTAPSPDEIRPTDVADQGKQQVAPPGLGLARWINPATAPFIPVPVIGADPNSGTTLGILPTWVHTNDQDEISRIVAPDLIHNPNFGWGAHTRIFDYPSENEQWSLLAGISQRVYREFDAEYQTELSRKRLWSLNYSLIYDQSGTERFYGLGNGTRRGSETNYTRSQELAQFEAGLNLNHEWQLLFTLRPQRYEVRAGALSGVPSIESRFPDIPGLGVTTSVLNRLSVIYDTRDNLVVPTHGMQWIVYGGLASRHGILNDSLYSEAGIDGRIIFKVSESATLATHVALRYTPSVQQLPFWSYSSLGGDRDFVGGEQMLRGFGSGRYYDRNYFAASVEYRRTVFGFNAATSHVDIEATPFIDLGDVFSGANPARHLHKVIGVGFRGLARPFIVGYVDIGYGTEGLATFTGINYPF